MQNYEISVDLCTETTKFAISRLHNATTHTTKDTTMNANEYLTALNSAIDSRVAYESAKNADNNSMTKTLADLRKSMNHEAIATVMLASNVSADFVNKSERSTNRFNVYSAEKVANIARNIAKCAVLNHYTLAIVRVALALEAKDMTLTHKDAVAACSMSVKHTDTKRESVIKTARYAKHVAANTAATQSSSSLNALQAFNVLTESRDDSNVVTYRLNRDTSATQALIAALQA